MIAHVLSFIQKNDIIKPHSTIIVGLSGGPDSVCLLHILYTLQSSLSLKLIAAHLDHEWRQESAQDLLFCKQLCARLNITLITEKASTIKLEKKTSGSKEERGRLLRRCFFEQVAQTYQAQAIALGHHFDDQEETFFIRFLRGASIAGLSGMRPKAGIYVRPLLEITKQEILAYLHEHNLEYITDYTNYSNDFLRNRIRHILLPAFRTVDERFDTTFKNTLQSIQKTDDYLANNAQSIFDQSAQVSEGILWLNKDIILSSDPILLPRILVLWLCKANVPFTPTNLFFDEIIRFLQRPNSGTHQFQSWSIIKQKNLITIRKH